MNPLFLLLGAGSAPLDLTGKNLYWYGDSITFGTYTTTPGNAFTTVASELLGATEVNHGEPGSTIEKRVPIDPLVGGQNMIDRLSLVPAYDAETDGMLVFVYGMNDAGYNSANYNVPNFLEDYATIITHCITTKGWPANRILICSPSYATDAAFTFYASNFSVPAPDRARFDAFVAACEETADTFNTRYFDLNTATKNSGLLGSLDADGVHPNSANDDLMIFMGTAIAEAILS